MHKYLSCTISRLPVPEEDGDRMTPFLLRESASAT
jgi:hypothetical protein